MHAIDVLALQNEMYEYHKDSEGILEYINALEAAQKKSKRGTVNNLITDATLPLITMDAMLKTGAHPRTTDKWEYLDAYAQTWDAWETAYKTANMKERVRRLATGDNAAHDAIRQNVAPKGTAIDDLVNKDDLKYYFDDLAVAAITEKIVLEKLTAAIAALTNNNEALVATNSKLVEKVINLTRRLGRNTDSATSGTTVDNRTPKTCTHFKKEGFHKPDTCLKLAKNVNIRPTN